MSEFHRAPITPQEFEDAKIVHAAKKLEEVPSTEELNKKCALKQLTSEELDELMSKFLTNTDETGRFVVTSARTGRTYAIEPIGSHGRKWGDVDPATKKLTGSYGKKYTGAIKEEESMITPENGFKNIITLDVGVSPLAAIAAIDAKYPPKETGILIKTAQ